MPIFIHIIIVLFSNANIRVHKLFTIVKDLDMLFYVSINNNSACYYDTIKW